MSKEQTPITVEEKSLAYYAKNCADELIKTPISVLRYISELEQKVADNEQYANVKVLEALEREVIKARVSKDIAIKEKVLKHIVSEEVLDKYISDAQKYYETEVKPKYDK